MSHGGLRVKWRIVWIGGGTTEAPLKTGTACRTLALQNGADTRTVHGMPGHFSAGFTLATAPLLPQQPIRWRQNHEKSSGRSPPTPEKGRKPEAATSPPGTFFCPSGSRLWSSAYFPESCNLGTQNIEVSRLLQRPGGQVSSARRLCRRPSFVKIPIWPCAPRRPLLGPCSPQRATVA